MSDAVSGTEAAFVRATYEPGRWVVVVVRINPDDQGAAATVFDVAGDLWVPAPRLWAAIARAAQGRGVDLPAPGALALTTDPGVREWRHVAR